MRFEVIGPLRIVAPVDAGLSRQPLNERSLGGPKPRLVLALLLAEPNVTVSVDRLIDGVWGEDPPESARHTLQAYVSELRKAVGEVIERDGTGYVLRVSRSELDALDLEARVSEGLALVERDPATAARDLEAALALWRGRPYEEHPDQPSLQAEATRLEELRLAGSEGLCRARLAIGEPALVLRDLERLTREHPYREELRALQMLALYRSGRQADALRVFQSTRVQLADDLGIEPSPRLRRLEEQILLQDPDLDPIGGPAATATGTRTENPYMGLRSFREADASRFYGQDRLVASLLERVLGASSFTAVVGPSGSGKSSAVQAGLLPRVRAEAPGLGIALMQPGSQPFAELEAALVAWAGPRVPPIAELRGTDTGLIDATTRLADGGGLLLVVDQFEELFTLTEPLEATAFIAALVRAATAPNRRVHVLVTMRADFYDRPLADPQLGPLFAANVVNVIPLGPDELEAAATMPARQVDIAMEGRLVGRLIADVAGQPNALPLFQYALTELFDERSGARLDLATYERIGGVRKAVARRAESIYTRLGRPEQEAARQLFLRIATVAGDAVSRRRVPASELTSLTVDIVALQEVIDAFARYRLLALDRDPTTGAPTVEVAHEALLVEWHRLRDWLDESREDLTAHARFVVALNEWEAAGREPGYLLAGGRLDDYQGWASTTELKLTHEELTFLERSSEAQESAGAEGRAREAQAQRLQRRTRWQLVALFAAVAVLVGIIAYPLLTADAPPHRVAIALEYPRAMSDFDELLGRGVDRAGERFGVDAVVLEPPYADAAATFADLASDSDLVFGTAAMWDAIASASVGDEDTIFVLMDSYGAPELPNAVAVEFANEEGSYLVGAAAALESQTGKIGYIGANTSPLIEEFRSGFEQGAKAVRPDIEIVESIIDPVDLGGGYAHAEQAAEIAEWQYREQGVDVIYAAAGESGFGTIDVANRLSDELGRHLWAIGVDTDSVFDLPTELRDHVLTSMVKRLDRGVVTVVAAYEDGRLRVPSTVDLDLADDALGYSTSGNHLQPSTIEVLDELRALIIAGEIGVDTVPTGPVTTPPGG